MKVGSCQTQESPEYNIRRGDIPGYSCCDCQSQHINQVELILIKSEYGNIVSEPFLICAKCKSKHVQKYCPSCKESNFEYDDRKDEIVCRKCGLVVKASPTGQNHDNTFDFGWLLHYKQRQRNEY